MIITHDDLRRGLTPEQVDALRARLDIQTGAREMMRLLREQMEREQQRAYERANAMIRSLTMNNVLTLIESTGTDPAEVTEFTADVESPEGSLLKYPIRLERRGTWMFFVCPVCGNDRARELFTETVANQATGRLRCIECCEVP